MGAGDGFIVTSPVLTVARFLLTRTRAAKGARWDQGARAGWDVPPGAPDEIAVFARRRVCGIPDVVARGILAWWDAGRPAIVIAEIPSAGEVLARQAGGARHVSLVDDARAREHGDARHPDGLSFALHDLCHLEKFVDPLHHAGQLGFFRACAQLDEHEPWRAIETTLDDVWRRDRDYVFADMNGSAIFLFAALKMKLAMALRRRLGQPYGGAVTSEERSAAVSAYDALFSALALPLELRSDAHAVSTRKDAPSSAARLLAHFEARGLPPVRSPSR